MNTIGLVLSGGGIKGVAHLALLRRLEELNKMPDYISGASAGALVAAMYASGKSVEEILELFKTTPLLKMSWLSPTKPGIFNIEKYLPILEKMVAPRFEDLKIPITIAATNMEKGQIEYFSEGDLLRPLLASCAVPGLYSPVMINGELYSDAGIMDNFPLKPAISKTDYIIGSYVNKPSAKKTQELNATLKVSTHANMLLLYACNEYKFQYTDFMVIHPLGDVSFIATNKIDEIYNRSYDLLRNSDFPMDKKNNLFDKIFFSAN